ncbi:adenylate/guanylate cyclase domain-containing protein [Motiliproteus sp.]|uniref:adenylate/guanylate cyclase domain-containing protein n=1 Tax=Motiliproteus sp. TaxID=1898955 RepID=UPI003BAC0C27
MANTTADNRSSHGTASKQLPFGLLAYAGAALSLLACYAQIIASLVAPLFGITTALYPDNPAINPHLQAVLMWVFGLVTVIGLARDRAQSSRRHPLVVGVCGLLVIVLTLYLYYDVRILILGYILLIVAALLNQNARLLTLKRQVAAQARELETINQSLEQRVTEQVNEINRLNRLKRFLAPEVVDLIVTQGKEPLLNSHRGYIATLFCDIRGFTSCSERIEPEESIEVLQRYHEHIGRLISQHQATIDHRAGDGLVVFFNDPLPCQQPVLSALKLALEIRSSFDQLNIDWHKRGYNLGLGVGIASGYATLGTVGFEDRYDYTANGSCVNLASRLCDEAASGQILMDHNSYLEVEQQVVAAPPREFRLKGFSQQVSTYEVRGLRDAG